MNLELKAKLHNAIRDCIGDNCEEDYWNLYIHDELYQQMTNACEAVFDSGQTAQQYYQHNRL